MKWRESAPSLAKMTSSPFRRMRSPRIEQPVYRCSGVNATSMNLRHTRALALTSSSQSFVLLCRTRFHLILHFLQRRRCHSAVLFSVCRWLCIEELHISTEYPAHTDFCRLVLCLFGLPHSSSHLPAHLRMFGVNGKSACSLFVLFNLTYTTLFIRPCILTIPL